MIMKRYLRSYQISAAKRRPTGISWKKKIIKGKLINYGMTDNDINELWLLIIVRLVSSRIQRKLAQRGCPLIQANPTASGVSKHLSES
jgi:hypothetical protein